MTVEEVVFNHMPSGSETALVSFSARGGGHNHFHFYKLLEPMPGLSKLLVRDPAPAWYNAGLPGVGRSVDEIAERIRQEVAGLGATRAITIGASMGGYGAILFGCKIGAERVVALSPQTYLDPVLPYSPRPDVELQVRDLTPVLRAAPRTKVDVVAGWDDLVDVFHARRVASVPSVRILAIKRKFHVFIRDLHQQDQLVSFMAELIEGKVPDICEIDPQLDGDSDERIATTVFAIQRRQWELAAERIAPVAERYPDWAAPSFALGRALAELSDWGGAAPALERAVAGNADWEAPRELLDRARAATGTS